MIKLSTITLSLAAFFGGEHAHSLENGNDIEVRIRTGAMVRGTDVTIGELCEITPINRDTLELASIVFAPTPAGGRARKITRTEIVQALVAAGRDVGQISFAGPDEILIQPVRVEVPTTELLESATAALQALLEVEGGDVEFEAPLHMRRVDTPPGRRSRILAARVRGGRTSLSSAVVDVDVVVDGKKSKRIPVQFKLQRFHVLLKTTSVVRSGDKIGPHNLTVTREPLAQATGLYLTRFEDVQSMVASRNLQSGSRITLGDIAPPAIIRKGEIVTVVLTRGRIKVTTKAMANHDAAMAARISLTNMQSRGMLTGVVAAPGLVVIHN